MSIHELSPDKAAPDLGRFQIIDVREEHEFHGPLGRISGARLIPLGEIADRASEISTDPRVLVVCRSGKRSLRGCEELAAQGVPHPTNLTGGMISWNLQKLPVEYTEPRSLVELRSQIVCWLAQVGPMTHRAASDVVRLRFERQGLAFDAPSHTGLDELLDFAEQCLSEIDPPDLDLSLAYFRRALAVL